MVDHRASRWIGTVLQDKWRIEAMIGRGGVATVFRATHRRGHVAAIKILHPEYARNADARGRFLREGYAANKVGHPGVVRVLDDDVTPEGSAYIVMELLDEGELLEAMRERRGGRLPVGDVVRIGGDVLDVLAAAHENGIVHRDIKPENVFVLRDGRVKVLDFGIAHIRQAMRAHEPTMTGLVLGTPEFMSPEQALGARGLIDAQTDIYAVGATIFTLLSGEAVHVHETLSALLSATSSEQARSLASTAVGKTLPRELVAVVDKALALEKPRRWASARAMQDALRRATIRTPASATKQSSLPPQTSILPLPPPPPTPRGRAVGAPSARSSASAPTQRSAPPNPRPFARASAPPVSSPPPSPDTKTTYGATLSSGPVSGPTTVTGPPSSARTDRYELAPNVLVRRESNDGLEGRVDSAVLSALEEAPTEHASAFSSHPWTSEPIALWPATAPEDDEADTRAMLRSQLLQPPDGGASGRPALESRPTQSDLRPAYPTVPPVWEQTPARPEGEQRRSSAKSSKLTVAALAVASLLLLCLWLGSCLLLGTR